MAAREVVHRCPVCGEPLKPTLGEKQYECGCCVMCYPAEVVNARHEHKVVLAASVLNDFRSAAAPAYRQVHTSDRAV